jgi:hypothetical protein
VTHDEFVAAWREGRVAVAVDPAAAARFLSGRLLLPFVAIAVIGAGIALVLCGWLWIGIGVGALGVLGPRLIKRGARGFLLDRVATDPELYAAGMAAGAIRVVPQEAPPGP